MKKEQYKILLVDDQKDVVEFLGYNLKKEGYQTYTATSGQEAIQKAREILPQLIILDVMMPEMDGIEACNVIREIPELSNTIIVFLTARGEEYSQIAGFDAGADDYITKPIKPRILISRVKAWLRRFKEDDEPSKLLNLDDIVIDPEKYLIYKNDNEITLPKKEFELLLVLTSKPNKVFTREEIFAKVWGNDVIVGDRTIDVHIRKLREKIGDKHIKTVKGVGYKYKL